MSASPVYSFGPFEVDAAARTLTRGGEVLTIGERPFDVLVQLLTNAGQVVSKESMISAVWGDVAVTDNSLEQAISLLRKTFGDDQRGNPYLETVPRRGYRLAVPIARKVVRQTDEALEALLAPHRAWIEGRAALETLERHRILGAREAFETVLASLPGQASAHLGLANACVMQFETTRADPSPDRAALELAVKHAYEACRIDPNSSEAWATLGFVLDRTGQHVDALAASRRAVMLDPGNWRHHFRLSLVSWGEARLTAAHQTLSLVPGFPMAHYTAATVYVARQALGEAERELRAGLASASAPWGLDAARQEKRFASVALNWLMGLVALSRGDTAEALEWFERELALEASGQVYARECAANTCYAMAALHWHEGRIDEARQACLQAMERLALHPMALALLHHLEPGRAIPTGPGAGLERRSEAALGRACAFALAGATRQAVDVVDRLLMEAPDGGTAWLLPVEPVLARTFDSGAWTDVLARLRGRAS